MEVEIRGNRWRSIGFLLIIILFIVVGSRLPPACWTGAEEGGGEAIAGGYTVPVCK
jgi:hypothetical protein